MKYILTEGLMCYLAHGALNYWLTTIQLTNTEQTALTRQCSTSLNTICSAGSFSVPLCYKSTPKFTIKVTTTPCRSKIWCHLSQTFTSIPFGFISPVKNKLLIYTLPHAYKSINVSSPPPNTVSGFASKLFSRQCVGDPYKLIMLHRHWTHTGVLYTW